VKTIYAVLHLGILISIAGCDPGVTIRQGDPQNESRVSSNVDNSPVLIHVKSTRQTYWRDVVRSGNTGQEFARIAYHDYERRIGGEKRNICKYFPATGNVP
jgi:hypothetical protein